jgi:hypothetical protein
VPTSVVDRRPPIVPLVVAGFLVAIRRLRLLGGRPLAVGMVAWVLVAGSAALGTFRFGTFLVA